jgi:DNA-binding SARP family transcriptional activator
MLPPITITLFGGLACLAHGQPLTLPSSAKARALLGYLALQQGTPQRRDYLAYTLWPDSTEEQARVNLRGALFDLTHAAAQLAPLLPATRATVALVTAGCRVDAQAFGQLVARLPVSGQLIEPPIDLLADLDQAVALYRGDLLPDLWDEWFSLPRERFRREVGQALLTLVAGYRQHGDIQRALKAAERLSAFDPLDEEAHRLLIDLQWRSGRADQARATLVGLIGRLRAELAAEPEAETTALGRRIEHAARAGDRQTSAAALAPPAFTPPPWDFVGRDSELVAIREAWREASHGRGGLLLVAGEAGIGKTRLVQEAIGRLDPPPSTILVGRARPGAAIPYGPLVGAVRRVLAVLPPPAWPALSPPWGSALVAFLPELGDIEPAGEVRRQQVHEAWMLLLRAFGPRVLLVIDDLQWVDDATLAYLADLSDRLAESALLVLATARAGDIGIETTVGGLLAEAERRGVVRRLRVDRMSAAESTRLVRAVGGQLTVEYAEQLSQRGAGHPLFLVELTKTAGAAGFALAGLTLPDSVRTLIADQTRRLSSDTRTLLQALSIFGSAAPRLLAEALGWPDERVAAAAAAPLRHQLLVEAGTTLNFAHDLMQEAVAADLTGPIRRLWHRRAAEALSRDANPDTAGQAAEHYLAAGDVAAALPLLLTAGEIDVRRAAPDAALSRFEQAAALAQQLGRDLERLRALLGLGQARLGAGYPDAAKESYTTARTEAQALRNIGAEIQAITGLIGVAFARDALPECLDLFHQALALPIPPGDEAAERALIQATALLMPLYGTFRPMWGEGREHFQRALQLAQRLGESETANLLADNLLFLTTLTRGAWPAAVAEHRRLGRHLGAGWILLWMGRARAAVPELEAAITVARRGTDMMEVAAAQQKLAVALTLIGDYQSGLRLLDQTLQTPAFREHARVWHSLYHLIVARELGLWQVVRAGAQAYREALSMMGIPDMPTLGIVEAARLHAEAILGDPQAALEQLTARAEQLTHPDYTLDRLMAYVAAADVALVAGQPAHALRAADAAIGLAEAIGALRDLAHAHRIRARAAFLLDDMESAESAIARARELAAEIAEPTLHWRILQTDAEIHPGSASARALLTATEGIRAQLPVELQPLFGVE